MNPSQIIQIAIWSVKVAIPTILFLIGMNLLIVSHSKWESIVGRLLGIDDLEISTASFVALKVFGFMMLLASMGIAYFLFIHE